jgi:hypothetical protein
MGRGRATSGNGAKLNGSGGGTKSCLPPNFWTYSPGGGEKDMGAEDMGTEDMGTEDMGTEDMEAKDVAEDVGAEDDPGSITSSATIVFT